MKYDYEIKECHKTRNVAKCWDCLRYTLCVLDGSIDIGGHGIKTNGKEVINIMRNELVKEFLHTIYVPADLSKSWGELLTWLEVHEIRGLGKWDKKSVKIRLLEIKTKGNGSWKAFAGWRECYADTNHISDKFAEIYTYTETESGHPQKIAVTNPRYSVIIK